jgi:hypothetical protein
MPGFGGAGRSPLNKAGESYPSASSHSLGGTPPFRKCVSCMFPCAALAGTPGTVSLMFGPARCLNKGLRAPIASDVVPCGLTKRRQLCMAVRH